MCGHLPLGGAPVGVGIGAADVRRRRHGAVVGAPHVDLTIALRVAGDDKTVGALKTASQ